MGTKEEMDLKIKKQSEKIVLILACIFGICCFVYVYKKNNISVNPCDCADLSSKAQIVGEWHLGNFERKQKFRQFRDLYLKEFSNYEVHSVNGVNIKWDLWNEHFIEFYSEIVIYIDNR